MSSTQTLSFNANLLRAKVSKYAIFGVVISLFAILLATALSAYVQYGDLRPSSLVQAQLSNVVLWFLDLTPFFFAFWGQYVSVVMSYEAGAMVADQTSEYRHQQSAMESKAIHDATHDPVTDLPNRVLFCDRVDQAINLSKREKKKLAVILLDLDRFKEINDTLGHLNGDRLLKLVGMRLESVLRESDTLARIGGDEFAILLSGVTDLSVATFVAGKIQRAMTSPFILDELTLEVQASAGLVMFPEHGEDRDTLIQRADVAMYVAKHGGKGTVIYEDKLDQHSPHRLTLMGELRQAIENDELLLHFQPQIKAIDESPFGVEALVRWNHNKHGMMAPDDFIALAERTGLIKPLTRWVLKHALQKGALWHTSGLELNISINLSAKNLLDPDFPEILTGALVSTEFPKEYLLLEITETAIMADPDLALDVLNRISAMGVRISIDDFGTGYSSLSYLKQLPVSELKIDKSFVMDMVTNKNDAAIVKATIDLAHNLDLAVVAEGVEDRETMEQLKSLSCDIYQGFYFSHPVPSTEIPEWFQARQLTAA